MPSTPGLPIDRVRAREFVKARFRAAATLLELSAAYLSESAAALKNHKETVRLKDLVHSYPAWLRSNLWTEGSLADRQPWLPYTATTFLDQKITGDSRVFEYGAGGSTLFFASRVAEVVSVEHDSEWLERTAKEMERFATARWTRHLVVPVAPQIRTELPVTDPNAYESTDEKFLGMSFEEYARTIDRYPDRSFDVVLIDGRARPACFKHAVRKVKSGGYIVLDNAERPAYSYVENAARGMGLPVREFWGPGPYARYFWRTIFIRMHEEDSDLRVIVGSSGTASPGWIATDYPYVNLVDGEGLESSFPVGGVSAFLAEHVWEHLDEVQAAAACRTVHKFLRPGGYIRVAVPDGNHPDPTYIDYCKPGGHGPGADDHKVMYTLSTLSRLFESNGFAVRPLEWFDEAGKFHALPWDPAQGLVTRSTRFDDRNRDNATAYTSLIIDAFKS
jgi:predicted SAM-dependent methyltransferase